ncbi:MAG TPA: hypothetical protein VGI73_12885 [Solirubrobacterales bacterium]|jgi:hypothetical protein
MRKLEILALTLAAAGAISAVTASSAFSNYNIAGQGAGGSVVASQVSTDKNKFVTDVGSVTCSVAKFEGHQSTETGLTLTVHPTYGGCSLAGFVSTTVSTTSCSYRFETPETEPVHANITILCSTGTSILIKESLTGCEVSVPAQGSLSTVSFVNSAPNVAIKAEVTGITYTDNGKCPNTREGHTSSTGSYSGSSVAAGFTSSGVANEFMVT